MKIKLHNGTTVLCCYHPAIRPFECFCSNFNLFSSFIIFVCFQILCFFYMLIGLATAIIPIHNMQNENFSNECNLKLGVLYVYDEMANRLISLITRHVLSWQNYLFVKQEKKKDVQNATGDAMLKTTSGSMLEFIIMLINTMKFACFILYK